MQRLKRILHMCRMAEKEEMTEKELHTVTYTDLHMCKMAEKDIVAEKQTKWQN